MGMRSSVVLGGGRGFTFAQSQGLERSLWVLHEDEVWGVCSACPCLCFYLSFCSCQSDTGGHIHHLSSVILKLLGWLVLCASPVIKVCLLRSLQQLSSQIPASLTHVRFTFSVYKISFSTVFQSLDLFSHLAQTPAHSVRLHSSVASADGPSSTVITFIPDSPAAGLPPDHFCHHLHGITLCRSWPQLRHPPAGPSISVTHQPAVSPHLPDSTVQSSVICDFTCHPPSVGPPVLHFNRDVTSNLESQHLNSLLSHPN